MSVRESAIERMIVSEAKRLGIRTIKLSAAGAGDAGKPDRLFYRQGKVAFMEIKAPGGRLTELQKKWLEELRADGMAADWFDNLPSAIQFLRTHLL